MGFSRKSPYPPVEDMGYPGGSVKKISVDIQGVRKNLRISRGIDDSKKGYPQQGGARIFSGKTQYQKKKSRNY